MHAEYYNIPSNNSTIMKNDYTVKKRAKRDTLNEWETTQLETAIYQKKVKKQNDEYDILVDEFVDYDQNETLTPHEIKETKSTNTTIDEKDLTIEQVRKSLPIYHLKDELIATIKANQILVIEGETGSGKTTQIPQYLYEAGFCENNKKIGCTQPRRVAAMSVAARVAPEMNVKLGDRVGYSVRFESKVSDQTQIKYMTDGMLLREFLNDPTMSDYSVLIIDESHERTLQTDVLFGLLREITDERQDLKVLISSATCDIDKFCQYFDAPFFKIPGRRYPVETYYTKHQEADYVKASVVSVLQIHITQTEGDILVFLTGQEEIEEAMDSLGERIKALGNKIGELIVLPIYSALPSEKQAKIFLPTPAGARKVVLATNIAETSLTIDGIKFVIDCGYCKMNVFDARSRMDSLKIVPITKANAIQRAGRAGRVAPGKCFRLYKKCTYDDEFEDQPMPEIQRTNLGNVVLLLKSLEIDDIPAFGFMDAPLDRSLLAAIEELYTLSAIDARGALTYTGRRMVEIPCDPMISKMILKSENYGCSEEIMTIAAMLSLDNTIFYTPKNKKLFATQAHRAFMQKEGDHMTLLRVYNEYASSDFSSDWCKDNYIQSRSMKMARNIRDQLVSLADLRLVSTGGEDNRENNCKAITAGFFMNTAKFNGDGYKRIKSKDSVFMQTNSSFRILEDIPKYVVFNNIVNTSKEFMRTCTEIDPKWLTQVAPHIYQSSDFESEKKRRQKKNDKRMR